MDLSDRLEREPPLSPLLVALESDADAVLGHRGWAEALSKELLKDVMEHRGCAFQDRAV